MTPAICFDCKKPKANLQCGLCEELLCKNCAEFIKSDQLSFLIHLPPALTHDAYCRFCFARSVAPEIASYEEVMRKAKEVFVYFKEQSKETRLFKRKEKPLLIERCHDEEETLMRLAFLAAHAGFNALIDVEIIPKKLLIGTYQKTEWKGRGIPVQLDPVQESRRK